MNHLPLISVVIPTYNRAEKVCAAVDSILQQTYPNVEAVVVDDGSTDDTQARLDRYRDRVRVIHQANAGPSAAMNRGISAARGEFVSFLGSDDLLLPHFAERCISLLRQTGNTVPVCITNAILKRTTGESGRSFDAARLRPEMAEGIWRNVTEVLLTRFVLCGQTMAVRHDVLERLHGFDEALGYLEDYDLALRLSLLGEWCFVAEPLVVWRQSVDSLSRKALNETVRLKECEIRIRSRFRPLLAPLGRGGLPGLLERENRRASRTVRIESLVRSHLACARQAGKVLRFTERLRVAMFRRSPLYPGMRTLTVQAWKESPRFGGSSAPGISPAEIPVVERHPV